MFTEKQMDDFESAVRSILEGKRTEQKMSEADLGAKAFPHAKDSRRKVQSIRKGQGAGANRKPQKLRLPEVMNLCEALSVDFFEVIYEAKKQASK